MENTRRQTQNTQRAHTTQHITQTTAANQAGNLHIAHPNDELTMGTLDDCASNSAIQKWSQVATQLE